jgi:hypothetical protein
MTTATIAKPVAPKTIPPIAADLDAAPRDPAEARARRNDQRK